MTNHTQMLCIFVNAICLSTVVQSWSVHAAEPPPCKIRLVDVTASTGIQFRHDTGGGGQGYIVEGVVGGLATFDYDGDGLIDIYFTNGATLQGAEREVPPIHALYRNNGNWTFSDVTEDAGLAVPCFGLGVVVADYDNDGDQDLYLNNFGPNKLYRNNGNKTFTDVTQIAGVENGNKVGAGACFLDIDRDGFLDLFVGNYVDFTYENHVPVVVNGQPLMAGPQYYKSQSSNLYRNLGNGTFEDVSVSSGVAAYAAPAMGTVAADFDDDGDTDIFVACDGAANLLLRNDGSGKFSEEALLAGVACDISGKLNGSMGVDFADADGDRQFDLFVTNYQSEIPVLYRNLGNGMFADVTRRSHIPTALFPHVSWGTGFADFDNDGDQDILVACGHFDRVEQMDDRTAQKVPNFLLMNQGRGVFADVSRHCGSGLAVIESSRGVALDDLDNDGDIDAVILNSNSVPTIMRNESDVENHWLQVRLDGNKCNRDAVGARVNLIAQGLEQVAQVCCGRGYQSHFGTRLHFGLGAIQRFDSLKIQWPSGDVQVLSGENADKLIVVEQPTSRPTNKSP